MTTADGRAMFRETRGHTRATAQERAETMSATDASLARRARAGDQDAADALAKRYPVGVTPPAPLADLLPPAPRGTRVRRT